ncbi:MAG: pyridoxamine 5'-phosphate oxidase family protein [Kiloniellales bacterium]
MTETTTPAQIMFTQAVRAEQERLGSRRGFAQLERDGAFRGAITDDLRAFLAERDSAFLATASAAGQPYVQHRGGPKGFLRPLSDRRIGFADFAGNRQYITIGNLSENPRAFLFLIDFATQTRVKLWGRLTAVEDQPGLTAKLAVEGYRARVERVLLFDLEAWDINCKQHLPLLFDETVVKGVVDKLTLQISALEAEVERLKSGKG